jgi:FkbM family methyltransferase
MNLQPLLDLLKPKRITEIVDIGANPIDGDPPYKPMLRAGEICRVTGFEPQEGALKKLNDAKSKFERYLPYAVGDGSEKVFNICSAEGMSSTFKPDSEILKIFHPFDVWGQVVSQQKVLTKTLDSISEIEQLDFLKIDIQGGELNVFQHGKKNLLKRLQYRQKFRSFLYTKANQHLAL